MRVVLHRIDEVKDIVNWVSSDELVDLVGDEISKSGSGFSNLGDLSRKCGKSISIKDNIHTLSDIYISDSDVKRFQDLVSKAGSVSDTTVVQIIDHLIDRPAEVTPKGRGDINCEYPYSDKDQHVIAHPVVVTRLKDALKMIVSLLKKSYSDVSITPIMQTLNGVSLNQAYKLRKLETRFNSTKFGITLGLDGEEYHIDSVDSIPVLVKWFKELPLLDTEIREIESILNKVNSDNIKNPPQGNKHQARGKGEGIIAISLSKKADSIHKVCQIDLEEDHTGKSDLIVKITGLRDYVFRIINSKIELQSKPRSQNKLRMR